jgi:catechol 2,3-dioxygenase-like lactoylglutathione lyase family enzyme
MKRLHVHVGVSDLDRSIAFYSTLFGAQPAKVKPDYARWMLDDPRVNFAISAGRHETRGIQHLGIQAEDEGELAEVHARLKAADRPVLNEGATTCCYAQSEKSWIADPDGVVWEAFLTNGEATVYGDSPALTALSEDAADAMRRAPAMAAPPTPGEEACCDAGTPQGACCEPKAHLPAGAPCCG